MRYDGTRASLLAEFSILGSSLEIHDHLTGVRERVTIPLSDGTGHGGGDFGVVASFVRAMRGQTEALTSARASLESHLLAFAAEESRHRNVVIDMHQYREKFR